MRKRLLATLICLCMVATLLPTMAFADGENATGLKVDLDGSGSDAAVIYPSFEDGWNAAVTANSTEQAHVSVKLLADWTAAADTSYTTSFGTGDGFQNGRLRVPSGKSITLDLNGKTIDRNLTEAIDGGYVILNQGTLTIEDNSGGTPGGITGGNGNNSTGCIEMTTGTLNLKSGRIYGNNCTGSGIICLSGDATFNMTGGEISGNNSMKGCVCINTSDATFNMTGGSITGNTGSWYGGVDFSLGTFNVSGSAKITGNTNRIESTPCNVHLYTGKTITVTGALDTDASIGVTTATTPTDSTPVLVAVGNTSPSYQITDNDAAKFTSDNTACFVQSTTGSNSVVQLVEKATPTTDDFDFSPPADLNYNGSGHAATVTAKSTVDGMGAVTIKYNGSSTAPKNAGTYTVTTDVALGTKYKAASDIEIGRFSINPRPVTISGITAKNKVYDGTADAELDCTSASISGTVGSETLAVSASGHFDTKNVGNANTVIISAITLQDGENGGLASNYTVSGESQSTAQANITPRPAPVVSGSTDYTIKPEGGQGTWSRYGDAGLSFRSTGTLSGLRSVAVDGNTLDSESFTAASGNGVITLHADYLTTLSVGTHTLRAIFSDGYAQTTFTVAEAGNPFADIAESDWFYEDVMFAFGNGMMEGTGDTAFNPHGATTRGMIVTILYRLEGEPTIMFVRAPDKVFSDVADGAWYEKAVQWAQLNGIVDGYGDGTFGPEDPITREQLAAILYRYAMYKNCDVSVGEDTNILSYNDAFDVSEYAIPAMQWACGAGLINGNAGNLMPQGNAQRCQAAAILHRFCEIQG